MAVSFPRYCWIFMFITEQNTSYQGSLLIGSFALLHSYQLKFLIFLVECFVSFWLFNSFVFKINKFYGALRQFLTYISVNLQPNFSKDVMHFQLNYILTSLVVLRFKKTFSGFKTTSLTKKITSIICSFFRFLYSWLCHIVNILTGRLSIFGVWKICTFHLILFKGIKYGFNGFRAVL